MTRHIDIAQMTLAQISELLHDPGELAPEVMDLLRQDPRRGARKAWRSLHRRQERHRRAERRLDELLQFEKDLRCGGARAIAGLDEAGRGPLAGPVVAAAVILPWPCEWLGLDDSKRLAAKERQEFARHIMANAIAVGQGIIDAARIDRVGIVPATWEAMHRALAGLLMKPDHLLVDGPFSLPAVSIPQTPLVKGDARSLSIAAASVVAKVTRDGIMRRLAEKYPQYGFLRHKGYGTAEHLAALRCHGPCLVHRRSFRHVSESRA